MEEVTTTEYEHFAQLDIRVGTIIEAQPFEKARVPAYQLQIDFGTLGTLRSSAQITEQYALGELVGKQVVAVVNFEEKQIANFFSQALVLGVYGDEGVVLLTPDKQCSNGQKIG